MTMTLTITKIKKTEGGGRLNKKRQITKRRNEEKQTKRKNEEKQTKRNKKKRKKKRNRNKRREKGRREKRGEKKEERPTPQKGTGGEKQNGVWDF